jgi:hypothetical protein
VKEITHVVEIGGLVGLIVDITLAADDGFEAMERVGGDELVVHGGSRMILALTVPEVPVGKKLLQDT